MQKQIENNKKNFEEHDTRLIRILNQTANYDEFTKKINDNDA